MYKTFCFPFILRAVDSKPKPEMLKTLLKNSYSETIRKISKETHDSAFVLVKLLVENLLNEEKRAALQMFFNLFVLTEQPFWRIHVNS